MVAWYICLLRFFGLCGMQWKAAFREFGIKIIYGARL